MTPYPREKWPERGQLQNMVGVWVSSKFMAQAFDEGNGITRVSVNRTMINDSGMWDDSISWDELMLVKREVGFGDRFAYEILPSDDHIVNVANMRHFWVFPEPLPFGWKKTAEVSP